MAQFGNATRVAAVTPSDSVGFQECESLWCTGSGAFTVSFVCRDGSTATVIMTSAMPLLPVKAVRVNSTGTTANSVVAFY